MCFLGLGIVERRRVNHRKTANPFAKQVLPQRPRHDEVPAIVVIVEKMDRGVYLVLAEPALLAQPTEHPTVNLAEDAFAARVIVGVDVAKNVYERVVRKTRVTVIGEVDFENIKLIDAEFFQQPERVR